MAATGTPTPNIGLRCPVGTDPASVDDINFNSGVIDTKLGAVGSTSVQAQIDALNSNIATSSVTAALSNNISWGTNSQIIAKRSGKVVTVTGVINVPSGGISQNTTIATVSDNKPLSGTQTWFGIIGVNAYRGTIYDSGAINTEISLPAGYHSFNFTYCTA